MERAFVEKCVHWCSGTFQESLYGHGRQENSRFNEWKWFIEFTLLSPKSHKWQVSWVVGCLDQTPSKYWTQSDTTAVMGSR